MVKHNNIIPNRHFHKDWQNRVRVWLDQPKRKERRRAARKAKAAATFPRPTVNKNKKKKERKRKDINDG